MIRAIVAYDSHFGIAKSGAIPWQLPADRAYFRQQTQQSGGHVLVGGSTFRSLPRAGLPGRQLYVLTRQPGVARGVTAVHDLFDFVSHFEHDLWAIGGQQLYGQLLAAELIDEIYATEIEADFGCDLLFPPFQKSFECISESEPQQQNGLTFCYKIYKYTKC